MIKVACPKCKAGLQAPDGSEGKSLPCPRCRNILTVPSVIVKPAVQQAIPNILPPPPPVVILPAEKPSEANSLGIGSMVVGCISIGLSIIPCIGWIALPLAAIGVLLGFIGLVLSMINRMQGIGMVAAGFCLSLFALGIGIFWLLLMYGMVDPHHPTEPAAKKAKG